MPVAGSTLNFTSGGTLKGSTTSGHQNIGALTLNNGGTLQADIGYNSSYENLVLAGTVTVTGTSASRITTSGADFSGVHLAPYGSADDTLRTFEVADVTGDTNADLTVSARLLNSAGQAMRADLIKSGAGTMTLAGINTYSSGTTITDGTLKLGSAPAQSVSLQNAGFENTGSLGAGGWAYNPTGTGWTFDGGTGISSNGQPWVNTAPEGTHAAFIQNNSISQVINFGTSGTFTFSFKAANRPGHNPIGLLLQVDGVTVASLPATGFATGAVFQPYSFTDIPITAGNHTISVVGNNTIGGDTATAIDDIAIFAVSRGELPSNTALNLTTATAVVDLNGYNQTIGSLAGVAGANVQNIAAFSAGGDGTTTTYAGVISGPGSFTKTGAGTLTLSGANTYAGSTTLADGHLRFASVAQPAVVGPVVLANPGSFLLMDQPNQFGPNSTLTFSATGGHAEFALYGNDQTIAGLSSLNELAVVQNSHNNYGPAAANSTLTVNQNFNSTYSGYIRDNTGNDGVSNGIEYFLGGIGNTTGNSNPLPGVTNNADTLSITWIRHPDFPGNYGTAFVVETSATLAAPWAPAVTGVGAGFVEINGNNVKYTFPVGTKSFARLKVVVPTP